jgi:N-acetylmuramoyl-L-alanine amidase
LTANGPVRFFLGKRARTAFCALLLPLFGCDRGQPSAAPRRPDDVVARAILDGREDLDRFELVGLCDRLAIGAGADGTRLLLAAQLREHLFRTRHQEVDGREALVLFDAALAKLPPTDPGRCATLGGKSLLAGDIAGDPSVTARQLATALASAPTCAVVLTPLSSPLLGLGERRTPVSTAPAVLPGASVGVPEEAVSSPDEVPDTGRPVEIKGIEVFGAPEGARVVVRLSGPARFKFGDAGPAKGKKGARVYVDIARAKLGKRKQNKTGKGILEGVRLGQREDDVRVVLDLEKAAFRRVFYLPEPFRVVIDVTTRAPGEPIKTAAGSKRELRRVVIDPGHGGHDPGAVGPSGLKEKDVTLDIAHRVGPVLARELGVTTLLTRDDDAYIALEERTARANAFGADVFVSIHCNASEASSAHGVQTFVLDTTSDHVAAKVAARENAASAAAGDVVRRLSGDLKLADLGSRSTKLADLLQRAAVASLDRYPNVSDQGVKTAGFFVLVGAQMPSALFETSFISNPTEEERLRTEDYRQHLADAIVNALRAYREGK